MNLGCPVVGAQPGMGQAAYTTTTWRRGCPSGSHRWLHNNIKLITQNIQLPGMKKKIKILNKKKFVVFYILFYKVVLTWTIMNNLIKVKLVEMKNEFICFFKHVIYEYIWYHALWPLLRTQKWIRIRVYWKHSLKIFIPALYPHPELNPEHLFIRENKFES